MQRAAVDRLRSPACVPQAVHPCPEACLARPALLGHAQPEFGIHVPSRPTPILPKYHGPLWPTFSTVY
eukprot:356623-Chlamydomonas_euryale.AAC.11